MAREKQGPPGRNEDRQQRLATQLRENLARRKAQSRARRSGEADDRGEGIEAVDKDSSTEDRG